MKPAIIFDMDGVLINSEVVWKQYDGSFFSQFIHNWNEHHQKEIVGKSIYDIYEYLKQNDCTDMSKQEFLEKRDKIAHKVYTTGVQLILGVKETLANLKQKDYTIAIASSSPLKWIDTVINRFNLTQFFDHIISSDHVGGKGKPAPDIYLYAAKTLSQNPKNCIVIEDATHGITSAKHAGMYVIGFTDDNTNDQDLSSADTTINTIPELLQKIKLR